MGKGGLYLNTGQNGLPEYGWDEIEKHAVKGDRWLVVDGVVVDVSRWCKKHPGGERIISNCAGQDATDAWIAFHNDKEYVSKYLKPLIIGRVKEESERNIVVSREPPWMEDFRKLRQTAEDMNLFKTDPTFFVLIMAHILFFDFLGWFVMYKFGTSWIPYIIGAFFLATAQAQAGWSQHDYGHLSVFRSSRLNHWTQVFVLNFFKGASCDWWNYRHYNHHSKPNIIRKDPDIRFDHLFLLGKVLPLEWGKKKKGVLPFQHQHYYFFLVMPPLLLPLYFNYEIPYFIISRKRWWELFWMLTFHVRFQFMFHSMLGFWGVLGLYMVVRFIESHWFVWATQMSHIPREVDYDHRDDWVSMQLKATCNVEQSFFNDWFSGHLNFQIEHHLFPTMPRHNLHKIAPLVKSMCDKYELEYINKSLFQAFADIVGSLKESGEMWYEAYNM